MRACSAFRFERRLGENSSGAGKVISASPDLCVCGTGVFCAAHLRFGGGAGPTPKTGVSDTPSSSDIGRAREKRAGAVERSGAVEARRRLLAPIAGSSRPSTTANSGFPSEAPKHPETNSEVRKTLSPWLFVGRRGRSHTERQFEPQPRQGDRYFSGPLDRYSPVCAAGHLSVLFSIFSWSVCGASLFT